MKIMMILLVSVVSLFFVPDTAAQENVRSLLPKEIEKVKRNYKAEGEQDVKMFVFSDLKGVKKGEKIKVGILFEIKPGMNIYGPEKSSSNLPTEIRWVLPEGVTPGQVLWQKIDEVPGGKKGYTGYCLVVAELAIGTDVKEEELKIGVEASFQVCDEVYCTPGETANVLTLSIGKNIKSPVEKIFRNR